MSSSAKNSPSGSRAAVNILRIYTKDVSFESPEAPASFTKQMQPEIRLNVGTRSRSIENNVHEVTLELTADAKVDDKTVFIAEVEQAGLFQIEGLEPADMQRCLSVFCPDTLFPYARQVIDGLLAQGSLPPLMLAPINFDQVYQQSRKSGQQPQNPTDEA